jgi:hypothetical protein
MDTSLPRTVSQSENKRKGFFRVPEIRDRLTDLASTMRTVRSVGVRPLAVAAGALVVAATAAFAILLVGAETPVHDAARIVTSSAPVARHSGRVLIYNLVLDAANASRGDLHRSCDGWASACYWPGVSCRRMRRSLAEGSMLPSK